MTTPSTNWIEVDSMGNLIEGKGALKSTYNNLSYSDKESDKEVSNDFMLSIMGLNAIQRLSIDEIDLYFKPLNLGLSKMGKDLILMKKYTIELSPDTVKISQYDNVEAPLILKNEGLKIKDARESESSDHYVMTEDKLSIFPEAISNLKKFFSPYQDSTGLYVNMIKMKNQPTAYPLIFLNRKDLIADQTIITEYTGTCEIDGQTYSQ